MARYKVNVGISYRVNGAEKRAEPGDTVDLPPGAAEWMLEDGVIEKVSEPRKTATHARGSRGPDISRR